MRIVIVGGGISGLACWLFLRKNLPPPILSSVGLDITIIESHAATRRKQRSGAAVDEAAGQVANTVGAALGIGKAAVPTKLPAYQLTNIHSTEWTVGSPRPG